MAEDINRGRRRFLRSAATAIAAGRLGVIGPLVQSACAGESVLSGGELESLREATEWLNSEPLSAEGLRGKVVLVDVCTYTCINWLRTLPYVRAWNQKYKDRGLVTIGVHSPEFGFERNVDNVRRALKAMNVTHPIAIDNEFGIWRGFNNQYWPALYLVDATGRIRYHHFGEGEYERSEGAIQQRLAEAGAASVDRDLVTVTGSGLEAPADWRNLKSPESYVGTARAENFASPGGLTADERRLYRAPPSLALNQWALSGDWAVHAQPAASHAPNDKLALRFHARDLHLVMGPPRREAPVRFRVRLDGQPPTNAHGAEVDAQGNGVAADQRLYQLIRQPEPIEDRQFEIEFLDPGVEVFAFTFG